MNKPDSIELTQSRILDAARSRFRQFGFNKTTLAEIAKDCAMSTANLYRFFENKLDIEAALAAEYLSAKESALQEAAESPNLSYADRLLALVLETVRYGYKIKSTEPRISEMIDQVITQRKDLMQKHRRAKQSIFTGLFEAGLNAGEFHIADAYATAQAVRAATTLFDTPQLTQAYPLEELERLATNVCALMLYGISTPIDMPVVAATPSAMEANAAITESE